MLFTMSCTVGRSPALTARALGLAALVISWASYTVTQSTLAEVDFESADSGFEVSVAGAADGNYNLFSKDAARGGQAGLRVTVTKPGAAADATIRSPIATLSGGASYTFEFWARTVPNPGSATFVVQTQSGQVAAQGTQTIQANNWSKYQIPFQPTNGGPYQLLIQIGTTATAFHLDDYMLYQKLPTGTAGSSSSSRSDSAGSLTLPAATPLPTKTSGGSTPPSTSSSSSGGSTTSRTASGQLIVDGSKTGVLFNHSFEDGPGGFQAWVSESGSGKPSIELESPKGAHTGKFGIAVDNPVVQQENFYVQLKTPFTSMKSDMVYTMSFWARTDTPGVMVQVDLLQDQKFSWVTGMGVIPTLNWTRYSMDAMQVPEAGNYFVGFAMGHSNGTFFFDDFTLSAEKGSPVRSVAEVLAMANPEGSSATLAATTDQVVIAEGAPSNSSGIDVKALVSEFEDEVAKHRKGNMTITFKDASGKDIGSLDSLQLQLQSHDFVWGTAVNHSRATPAYWDTVSKYFNGIVNENILKWADYEPTQGDYKPQEKIWNESYVTWAEEKNMKMIRGHTIEWLHDGYGFDKHWSRQYGCDKYKQFLKERIMRDMGAFKGRVTQYDVWNELLNQNNFARKCNFFEDGTIADALKWAKQADPTTKKCMNDFWLIDGLKTQDMVNLVTDLRKQGAEVDCIGIQAHLDVENGIALGSMSSRLKQLAALGVPLVISEFDIRSGDIPDGPTGPFTGTPTMRETPEAQAAVMVLYTASWFAEPAVEGIFLWGFADGWHWINNGGIFDSTFQPKPAALALDELWTQVWTTKVDAKDAKLTGGKYTFNGFFGSYSYTASVDGKVYSGTVDLPKHGSSATVTLSQPSTAATAIAGRR